MLYIFGLGLLILTYPILRIAQQMVLGKLQMKLIDSPITRKMTLIQYPSLQLLSLIVMVLVE